jgi:hypothetical protein
MNRRLLVALLLTFAVASALAQEVARVKVIHAYPKLEGPTVNITISAGSSVAKTLLNVPFKVGPIILFMTT